MDEGLSNRWKTLWQQECMRQIQAMSSISAVFVIEGPFACGKTTLVKQLAAQKPDMPVLVANNHERQLFGLAVRYDGWDLSERVDMLVVDNFDVLPSQRNLLFQLAFNVRFLILVKSPETDLLNWDLDDFISNAPNAHVFNVLEIVTRFKVRAYLCRRSAAAMMSAAFCMQTGMHKDVIKLLAQAVYSEWWREEWELVK